MDGHKEQGTSLDAEVLIVPLDELLLADNKNGTTTTVAETVRINAGNETQTPMCVSCAEQSCICGFRKSIPYFS